MSGSAPPARLHAAGRRLARRGVGVGLCLGLALVGVQCVQDLFIAPKQPSYAFSVSPESVLVAVGDTAQPFTAVLTADGQSVGFQLHLSVSQGDSVVRVDSLGRLMVLRRGLARLTAQPLSSALTTDTLRRQVSVRGVVARLAVPAAPSVDTLRSLGDSLRLRAFALTRRADTIPSVPIAWRLVSGAGVVTLLDSTTGLVRAAGNGLAEFLAALDTATARRLVRVQQVAASVTTPDSLRLIALGQSVQIFPAVRDARGNGMSAAGVLCTSLDAPVTTVDAVSCLVTSRANGVARIEARLGALADTTRVTVAQVPRTLAFISQPSVVTAGVAIAPAVQVSAQDSLGNTVTSATNAVTATLGANPGGGTLSGTTTVAAVSGLATFSDLRINRTGSGYTLAASAAGLTGATSSAFTITPAPAAQLVFSVQPGAAIVGQAIGPAPRVTAQDAFGNTATGFVGAVTVALGTTPVAGAALSGVTTVNAVSGVATFSSLSISQIGAGFTLAASATGLTAATSGPFSVTGPPSRLAFTVQPGGATAGVAIAPAVQVSVQDSLGNTVRIATSITVALGANPGGGTLSGTTTVAAVNGVAAFSNLRINRTGSGYTLVASAVGVTGATSAALTITPAPATRLGFAVQPTNAEVGAIMTPPVKVAVQDSLGNTVTSATNAVTVAIGANPGGGTLAGTRTVGAVAGVATFSDLSINQVGTGYTLTASVTGLTSATSAAFQIAACTDAFEPNNSFATAASLTSGVALNAKICSSTDSDYFKFTVTAGQGITVTLAPPTGLDYHVTLYDPSQLTLTDVHTGGVVASTSRTVASGGTYYVKVYGFGFGAFSTTTPYTLTVTVQDLLTVSPAAVTGSAPEGTTTVQTAALTLSGTSPLTWTATLAQTSAWLSLSPASGTTPSTLTLTMNPTGLAPGVYRDTVIVTAPGAAGSPDATPVTFTITCTDALEPNDGFAAARPLTSGVAVSAKLCESSDSDYFSISVTAGQTIRLALTPPTGFDDYNAKLYTPAQNLVTQVGSGNPAQTDHVAAFTGTYYVNVSVAFFRSVSQTLPYTLTVTLLNQLTVTPAAVTGSALEGTTTVQTAALTLSGTSPLAWTATRAQSSTWLSLSPVSGTTPSTLTLTMNPTGLAPGVYRDTVIVTAPGALGSPDSTPVAFTIACTDALEPNDGFAAAKPLTSGVAVSAKLCTSSDSDYFSISVTAGQTIRLALTPPTAFGYNATLYTPAQNVVTTLSTFGNPAQTDHVAAFTGTYYVKVFLAFGSVSTTLPYTLTVTLLNRLTVTPAAVTGSAAEGTTTVQTSALTLSGTSPLAWTATRAQSSAWLSLSPASGTTPSTLTLTMNPTGLAFGVYRDTLIVTAPGALGSPDSTPVTFTITCPSGVDSHELNNSFAAATPVTSGVGVCALISSSTDVDYFRIAVTGGQTITATMTGPPQDFDLRLFNPSQVQVGSSGTFGSTESIVHTATATGNYYVQVFGFAGAFNTTSPYRLTVTVQ